MFSAARGGFDYYSPAGLSLTFVGSYSVTNASPTNTITGVSANIGDIIVLINNGANFSSSAAPPALATPSGFTNVLNLATPTGTYAQRTAMCYQISTTGGSRTLTGFSGTFGSSFIVFVYRPSSSASSVSFVTLTSQIAQNAAASNQSPTFPTMTNAMVVFGYGGGGGGGTAAQNLSSTLGYSHQVTAGATIYAVADSFEGSGFSGSSTTLSRTISTQSNTLFSAYMTVS